MIKKHKWDFLSNRLLLRPLISALIAFVLTFILSYDITSDNLLSVLLGSSDIEVCDFYNRVRAGGSQKHLNEEITVINIDSIHGREELGILLLSILDMKPRFVGFDVILQEDKDSVSDIFLKDILESSPNIVASQKFDIHDLTPEEDYLSRNNSSVKRGMANLLSKRNSDMIREFRPFMKGAKNYPTLSSEMLKNIDSNAYAKLCKLDSVQMIRFSPTEFYVVDAKDIDSNMHFIKDKIVFIGTITEKEDLHVTPLSKEYPGVLIHANILSMILHDDYTAQSSNIFNIILAIISCLGLSFLYVYLDDAQNLAIRIIPIIWMLIVVFFGCWWFDSFGIYINAPQTLLLAAFSILVLDFWSAFDRPIKKFIFKMKKTLIGNRMVLFIALVLIFGQPISANSPQQVKVYSVNGKVVKKSGKSWMDVKKLMDLNLSDVIIIKPESSLRVIESPKFDVYTFDSAGEFVISKLIENAKQSNNSLTKKIIAESRRNIANGNAKSQKQIGACFRGDIDEDEIELMYADIIYSLNSTSNKGGLLLEKIPIDDNLSLVSLKKC